MTDNPVSDTSALMPKEKFPDVMTIRLREGTFERIDAITDQNKRGEWIRDLIERELKRQRPRKPGTGTDVLPRTRMVVCEHCGNKRCPHATNPELACTNSNDPGQPGSAYE